MLARRFLARSIQVRAASTAHAIPSWAKINPDTVSGAEPAEIQNLLNGEWVSTKKFEGIKDPLNGEVFLNVPLTQKDELKPFIDNMLATPKHGLHNPFKNVERYLLYGDVSHKAAAMLRQPEVEYYFCRLIQRVAPKSYEQAKAEVVVTRKFLENFSGDQVRFLARSFGVPGDHLGQMSTGHRWPYGPVTLITPFNFPFEIPMLQLLGALYMGNRVTMKLDSKVAVVMYEALRMLHACGMPKADVDFINSDGPVMNELLLQGKPKNTLFTGSSVVAEKLAKDLKGRIKLEDAGFDWKILGPDVSDEDYVAWVCDQDAYACSGQKCSAQSILFMHKNWTKAGIENKMKTLAARRKLEDLTIGPVLTVTTKRMLDHVNNLLQIPGARVVFGGKELENHSIPSCYGAIEPTAVFVPIEEACKPENFELVTTEIFGPFQILTEYDDSQVDTVLDMLERMEAHLTASVVSNDVAFQQRILANSVNGTTYNGIRARTTGAPQNHWFGPAGDPRAGAIGTPEAIKLQRQNSTMADQVNYIMEKMIPELEDLQELQIFTKDEIRQIVQKRRDFEYTMKRQPLRKVDCLRYIEYELNLDALRRQRKKRMGLKKTTLSDHAPITRVHNIFERALMKHKGDIDLWLQHIAFCKNNGSRKLMSKLFTSALQMHPRNEAIWIEAASWEFTSNLNIDSARVLMQRSIRINPHSQRLWTEYFRLEFLYVQKLRVRREVLGLDAPAEKPKELSLDIEPLAEEPAEEPADKLSEMEQSRQEILNGAIPKIIYQNAIKAIPSDVQFRLKFVEISHLFPVNYSKSVTDLILSSLLADFPKDIAAWSAFCQQPAFDLTRDVDEARKEVLERYNTAIDTLKHNGIRHELLAWCAKELSHLPASSWFFSQTNSLFKKIGPISWESYAALVDFTLRTKDLPAAVAIAEKATNAFPEEEHLWLLRAQLVMRAACVIEESRASKRAKNDTDTTKFQAAVHVIEEGLRRAKSKYNLWQRYLQFHLAADSPSTSIEATFKKALAETKQSSVLRQQYITWLYRAKGIDAVRNAYRSFYLGQMLPNDDTMAWMQTCLDLEIAQPDSKVQVAAIKALFEKLIALYGKTHEDVWVAYITYYRQRGLQKDSNEVHWRATRAIPDSTMLANLHALE
ncbi:delta-1-pyrroline-5-carboxylate dehydrogenase 12A1, mitochondrial-like [Thraustotheca clavata]|uniref:Delta-1-pyrroline-5-carboxylate dehydrogenase 12A1, mitochondrial-like n=1 Tax=Thraustotheca clavata TaxID=74557 RepID=A0A1V9ZX16_9STRA|nr:delta-1-pyrroline-5-carboxylate dehydrogenase 12A1, mitochondrial-like [Thraustotheca clavata]